MKTNLLAFRIFVRVPEEWPAKLSPGHSEDENRITHSKLNLPASVHSILDEGLDAIEQELKAVHPDIELVVEK